MSARLSSVFPRPSASDPDDVVWTLQTAAVQWQRGLRADAIVWVRKAADLSTHGGRTVRADELRNHAARLAEFLWTDPEEPHGAPQSSRVPQAASAGKASTGKRVISDEDADEVIEIEELDSYELEFTETDSLTPEDAAADISPEDLGYYQGGEEAAAAGAPLPDDLDLRSDSEVPTAADSFMSISPEPEDDDGFISVAPESDSPESGADSYMEVSPESLPPGISSLPVPQSDLPTQPRIERPPPFRPGRVEPSEGTRLPTVPSPAGSSSAPAADLASLARNVLAESVLAESVLAESVLAESVLAESVRAESIETGPPASLPPISAELLSSEVSPAEASPGVDGLAFESVEALADLPEEAQTELAECARLVTLTSSEEFLLREGAALITHGQVHVTLPFSDVSGERVGGGAVVAARGSVDSGPLRLIADAEQTRLVMWTDAQLAHAMRDCPWVEDDLRQLADRLQAHAAAGLGPLGERLDDALRAAVYERLQVRVLAPEEAVAERGKPLKGLFVVAVGNLSVGASGSESISSGQFVFPSCVIGAEPAPNDVKAGPKGGVVLFATRPVAHELMMSVPPLLEILAS